MFVLQKAPTAIKLEGGGGKALARPLKKTFFFGLPLSELKKRGRECQREKNISLLVFPKNIKKLKKNKKNEKMKNISSAHKEGPTPCSVESSIWNVIWPRSSKPATILKLV